MEEPEQSETSTVAAHSEQETPATSQAPSEADLAQASTPPVQTPTSTKATQAPSHARKDTRTAVPIVPAIPNIPVAKAKSVASPQAEKTPEPAAFETSTADVVEQPAAATASSEAQQEDAATSPPPKVTPKSWADLVRIKSSSAASAAAAVNGLTLPNGTTPSRANSLADALRQYNVENVERIPFLEPRGLVNTGNMCYMNSVSPSGCTWRFSSMS